MCDCWCDCWFIIESDCWFTIKFNCWFIIVVGVGIIGVALGVTARLIGRHSQPEASCKTSEGQTWYRDKPSDGEDKPSDRAHVKLREWPALQPLQLTTDNWRRSLDACKRRLWKTTDCWSVVVHKLVPVTNQERGLDGKIVIPRGTIVDGASVPLPWLFSFLSFGILRPTGILLIPSIVHDYAYEHGCLLYENDGDGKTCKQINRADADRLFREMIRAINGTTIWAYVAWFAVRMGWCCVKYKGKVSYGHVFRGLLAVVPVAVVLLVAFCIVKQYVGLLCFAAILTILLVEGNLIVGLFPGKRIPSKTEDCCKEQAGSSETG